MSESAIGRDWRASVLMWSTWLVGPCMMLVAFVMALLDVNVDRFAVLGENVYLVGLVLAVVAFGVVRKTVEFWLVAGRWVAVAGFSWWDAGGLPGVVGGLLALVLALLFPMVALVRRTRFELASWAWQSNQ